MHPTSSAVDPLTALIDRYARRLAVPAPPPADTPWLPQSLSDGAAGIALLHVERAHTGLGAWSHAQAWITAAVAAPVSTADTTGLFLGMPAVAFLLDSAAGTSDRYRQGLADVDGHVAQLAHHRADAVTARVDAGLPSAFREYDVISGLAGIGSLLLRRHPGSSALEQVLTAVVALTRPLRVHGDTVPGWWVGHDPHVRDTPGAGHVNLGAAHGITGPLALLARARRRGVTVPGHDEAIETVLAWLDRWRQDGHTGPWWPETLGLDELLTARPHQTGPYRPSWCYGTPGIARAAQQAAIALGDTDRQRAYEQALTDCLADDTQLDTLADAGLCHGWAGLFHTVFRAAADADTPALAAHLPALAARLHHHAQSEHDTGPGLLTGAAGTALALLTTAHHAAPISGWDACLLID